MSTYAGHHPVLSSNICLDIPPSTLETFPDRDNRCFVAVDKISSQPRIPEHSFWPGA